jgi:hypothetical protein
MPVSPSTSRSTTAASGVSLSQEQDETAGRRLLCAARLLRQPDRYIEQFGRANYHIMLGDCLWHIYRVIGKLTGYAATFTKPDLSNLSRGRGANGHGCARI